MRPLRRSSVPAALLAPALFLAVDPAGWFPFGPAKWLLGTVLVLVAGALVAADGPMAIDRATGRAWAVLLGLLVLGAWAGIEGRYAWTGTPERSLGVATWVLFLVAFVVGQHVGRPEPAAVGGGGPAPAGDAEGSDAEPIEGPEGVEGSAGEVLVRRGLLLVGVAVGLAAVAEALGVAPAPIGSGGTRLGGTFGNASFLGAAAALLLPLGVAAALDRALALGERIAGTAAAALMAVALVGSGARAAWLGLAVAALVAGWVHRRSIQERVRRLSVAAALGVVAAVLVVGGVVVVVTPAGDRLVAVADRDAPGGAGRVDEWRVAVRVIADHPVTGVGPEGYRIAIAEGVDRAYERAHGRDPLPDRAHSAPLDVALAGGVGALLAWAVLVLLVGRSCVRVLGAGSRWRRGVALGLIAHGVGLLFLFPTFELDLVVWLLAGVVIAWDPRALSGSGRKAPTSGQGSAIWRLVAAGLGVAAAGALVVGVLGVVADRRAESAVRSMAAGDTRAGVDAAADAVRLRPDVLRYRLLAARARVAAGEGQVAAIRELDAALRLSPGDPIVRQARAQALVDRAGATLVPAHVEAARHAVDVLLDRDPHLAAAHLLDGDLAVVEQDADGAVAAWSAAADLAPRSAAPWHRLAALYDQLGLADRATAARERATDLDDRPGP